MTDSVNSLLETAVGDSPLARSHKIPWRRNYHLWLTPIARRGGDALKGLIFLGAATEVRLLERIGQCMYDSILRGQ